MCVIIQHVIVRKLTSGDEYASFIRVILCVQTKLKRQVCIRLKSPNSYYFERRASLMRRP